MGTSSWNPLRSRDGRQSKLPLYENLNLQTPSKERDSNDSYDDSDSDGYSITSSSPGTNNSRYTSASITAATPIMSKRHFMVSSKPRQPFGYRLPNKVVRYLCFGLTTFIVMMILTLIRASHNENRALAEGRIDRPASAPPPWESYPFLTRYYGGIRNLVSFSQNLPEYPRLPGEPPIDKLSYVNNTIYKPDVQERSLPASKEYIRYPQSVFQNAPEQFQECYLDKANKVRVPPVRYYEGRPNGFPEAVLGSHELLGLPEDICFERYGRYGPYGFGYSVRSGGLGTGEHGEKEGYESTWEKVPQVDWSGMDWADIQRRCYRANVARYKTQPAKPPSPHGFYIDEGAAAINVQARDTLPAESAKSPVDEVKGKSSAAVSDGESIEKRLPRTAVVIRCWDEYFWKEEDVMNIRSLISELALASGGRYDVHLLVQVKNDAAHPIWADSATYKKRIEETVPEEFRGLVTFWTETQMLSLYQGIFDLFARGPDLPVHGVYRGLQMAMQYFAYQHPEYDYYWQWEMDIRYIGHYYDLFTKIEKWAKDQPRKGLWERNGRFYVPSVHGTWEDFKQMVRVQSEMGVTGADNIWDGVSGANKQSQANRGDKPIWGPERPKDPKDWFEPEEDPVPETPYEKDKYVWGVGEEAEYITFNPMFDPEGTTWGLANDITGYNTTDGNGMPPRRAQIITASRMSRRLLMKMHRETAFFKHHAFPEMWPGTVALQHGYKAVFVPHPLYVDREWPTEIFARTLNNGKNGATGGSRTSVFGQREHNLIGLTWFYNSGFAPNLYRRWLGLKVNNDGGEEFEMTVDESKNGTSVNEMRGGEGRMCLPPMLLHPVKDIDLPVEAIPEEALNGIPESDPAA
ncbi:uncharacterized protein F4807DRAFT_135849 [Annulohypoxylon truncatum]|uniref:uncharacterized protein n=1 Tax=Annulohypoxylon truncatum TaxID=327061 RepID=UPI002007AFAA|nr:uncharacterized protein F4807DRAFT_135849 [Annulohypoxylon truncatum]KAI1208848.1 hypothetical protein F4807DRAFT_135849 [Annulohypoxylon truncatum]